MRITRNISIVFRVFLFLVLFFSVFITICLFFIGAPKEFYETSLIKKTFYENENIANIDRMVSQKDFSVCFDVYFTTTKNKKFVVTNVQIKDKEVVFVRFFKTNEDYEWLVSIDTGDKKLYENLSILLNNINDY